MNIVETKITKNIELAEWVPIPILHRLKLPKITKNIELAEWVPIPI